ncbi:MAG: 4-hydroxythreonine-4-phosphate dehydrogenase PdxA [Endomicrobiia bacterium]
MLNKKWLIISCGDVDGVGYELTLKLLCSSYNYLTYQFNPLVVGSLEYLRYVSYKYKFKFFPFKVNLDILSSMELFNIAECHCLVMDILPQIKLQKIKNYVGKISFLSLEVMCEVIRFFLRNKIDFFVFTMPVSKEKINKFYKNFTGHTEYFSNKFNIDPDNVSMLMEAEDNDGNPYRVLLLTRHIPLKEVPKKLNISYILNQVKNVVNFINKWEQKKIKEIVLCNLNPHGGEEGKIGTEEKKILFRAAKLLEKKLNLKIHPPLQASDAFIYAKNNKECLIVANYHDQAMVPLKLLCGYNITNITVGLPFIRVSPGHGPASDIALKEKVDVSGSVLSLKKLIEFIKNDRFGFR